MDRAAPWGMAGLLLYVLAAAAAGWRYFPGFSADNAWYLQVALRVSQGDVLYRDVAWAYGPLPAHFLAALFRWGGPDAAWASLVNVLLTLAGVLLTYVVIRGLLAPGPALLVTAFATLAGANPWYSLFHAQFYVYTQAVAWGGVASLAALAAALRWEKTGRSVWLFTAGIASGLATLSKPEFGLAALATCSVALLAGRSTVSDWWRYLLTFATTVMVGFGLQVVSAGFWPVWRGYSGYDQVLGEAGQLWGTRLGDRRLLLGGHAFWLAVGALWASRRWPRRRRWFLGLTVAGVMVMVAVGLTYLFGMTSASVVDMMQRRDLSGIAAAPANLLFLVSLPWVLLLPIVLGAGWLARGRGLPPAWWIMWTYVVASSLRHLLTGYANSFAVGPALAVFWVWFEDRLSRSPHKPRRRCRFASAALAGMAIMNLSAQVLIPNFLLNGPRVWIDTALGPVGIAQPYEAEYRAAIAFIDQSVPADAPVFSTGWGAHWYLLTQRPNPTAFDVVFTGLGTSGSDADAIEHDLAASPPAALILPNAWLVDEDGSPRNALEVRRNLPDWWQALQRDYVDQTPSGVRNWRVLLPATTRAQ